MLLATLFLPSLYASWSILYFCSWFPGLIIGATSYHCDHKGGNMMLQMMMTMLHLEHKAGLPGPPGHQQGLLHRALTQVHGSPHVATQLSLHVCCV